VHEFPEEADQVGTKVNSSHAANRRPAMKSAAIAITYTENAVAPAATHQRTALSPAGSLAGSARW
jgi:hypothetical protein